MSWKKGLVLIGLFICLCQTGFAEEAPRLQCVLQNGLKIEAQESKNGEALFLPAFAETDRLRLEWKDAEGPLWVRVKPEDAWMDAQDGIDLTALFPDGKDDSGAYAICVSRDGDDEGHELRILHSAEVASVFIISDDPESAGRNYVHALRSSDGALMDAAGICMVNAHGNVVHEGRLRELRGRGNTTWAWSEKKPYQFKLEQKSDLLESGRPENRERTWILLAQAFDASHAHDMIAFELAKQLGLRGTPECRPVDLWYDGEYRGSYLLCEKVQVKPGRLDVLDTDTYLEKLYPQIRNEAYYPQALGTNEHGEYQYTQNVEISLGSKAAYLIEQDGANYARSESRFAVGEEIFSIHTPKYASEADVKYAQQIMADMIETVEAGGVHPRTGKTLAQQADVDSIARYMLVIQMMKNHDIGVSSTFFYIENGKVHAGPVWDFDIACGTRNNRTSVQNSTEAGVVGYLPVEGWISRLMLIPDVQQAMMDIYREELKPLVERMIESELDDYEVMLQASAQMNEQLWNYGGGYRSLNPDLLYDHFAQNWQVLCDYMQGRLEWMTEDMAQWAGREIRAVALNLSYINADVAGSASVVPARKYQNCEVGKISWAEDREAGEAAWRTLYTAYITLEALPGVRFGAAPEITVNGCEAEVLERTDEQIIVRFSFQGPVHEPAVYDGIDYGLLYQYDYFVSQYPEIIEWYEDDRELALEEYVLYYLPEGVSGIETFDYEQFYENYEGTLIHYFASDTMSCMLYYLDNDLDELARGLSEPIYPKGEK